MSKTFQQRTLNEYNEYTENLLSMQMAHYSSLTWLKQWTRELGLQQLCDF